MKGAQEVVAVPALDRNLKAKMLKKKQVECPNNFDRTRWVHGWKGRHRCLPSIGSKERAGSSPAGPTEATPRPDIVGISSATLTAAIKNR